MLAQWALGGLLALAAFLFVRRYGGGAALAELERANGILERRVHELTLLSERQAAELAELRAKTDFVVALQPIMVWCESHEQNAVRRNDALLAVLDLIAKRLGPEPAPA